MDEGNNRRNWGETNEVDTEETLPNRRVASVFRKCKTFAFFLKPNLETEKLLINSSFEKTLLAFFGTIFL